MLPVKYTKSFVPSFFDRDEFLTPFSSMFDDLFNDTFDVLGKDFFEKGTYPKVDVRNEDMQMVIEAEIPGLTKEQINVELDNGVLRIKGEKKSDDDHKSNTYVHRELKHTSFCRSFLVGENINADKVDAKFENGVLEITLPKKTPEPKPNPVKKIELK